MAAGIFEKHQQMTEAQLQIYSAGLNAKKSLPANFFAQSVLKKYSIDIAAHRARQLSLDLIVRYDLLLVMTKQQLNELNSFA